MAYAGRLHRLLLRRRPQTVVGVDVRQSEVRWVRYGPAADGTINISADRVSRADLKEGLQAVAGRLDLAGPARVAATVESSRVVVRQAVLPPMPEREVGPALAFQLPQLIPGYTEQWGHDYVLLPPRDKRDRGERECLVAALPGAVIRRYYDAFKEAGLPLASLEVRVLALWRFLFGNGEAHHRSYSPCLAVLDPDDVTADLAVFENGRLRYTRLLAGWEADVAGEHITAHLVSEMEHSLSWYAEHRGRAPRTLLVVGGEDKGKVPGAVLAARLGLQVFDGGPAWPPAAGLAPGFAAAAGLALKEVAPA